MGAADPGGRATPRPPRFSPPAAWRQAGARAAGRWRDGALAVMLLALMVEWILPLPAVSDTGGVPLFGLLLALWTALRVAGCGRRRPVALLGVTLAVFPLFFDRAPWPPGWIGEFAARILADGSKMGEGTWLALDPVTRTAGFCLFLGVLSGLAYREAVQRRRPLGVVVGTVAYLAALDTFTPFEGRWAVIRATAVGLLLLAGATRARLAEPRAPRRRRPADAACQAGANLENGSRSGAWRWWSGAALAAALGVTVAALGPSFAPLGPDPLAWLPGTGPKAVQRIGYDDDDRRLGGPFVQDDTVVFTARTSGRHYWRGEVREVYTGRGWETRIENERHAVVTTSRPAPVSPLFQAVNARAVEQAVHFTADASPAVRRIVFYGGNLEGVRVAKDGEAVAGYTATALLGEVDVAALRRAPLETAGLEPYLQLPAALPARVREKARELTAAHATPYEKVTAILRHLRSGTYRYETRDVPVPGRGQDFVDHFLFESRRGYCDHFSTAMVVLLRAAGIPARWVKGFAPPNEQGAYGESEVAVRNRNAHSWVEVYFAGVGWVPFEPTPAFLNPVPFREAKDAPALGPATPLPAPGRPAPSDRPSTAVRPEATDTPQVAEAPWWRRWWPGSGVESERAKTAFGILVLALGCGAAVALVASPRRRFRLAERWVVLRAARRPYSEGLCLRFAWLYARWARRTDAPEGLTVRQFVAAVERRRGAPFPALRAWAVAYERVRYGGGEPDPAERAALERHWRDLIDRWPL